MVESVLKVWSLLKSNFPFYNGKSEIESSKDQKEQISMKNPEDMNLSSLNTLELNFTSIRTEENSFNLPNERQSDPFRKKTIDFDSKMVTMNENNLNLDEYQFQSSFAIKKEKKSRYSIKLCLFFSQYLLELPSFYYL